MNLDHECSLKLGSTLLSYEDKWIRDIVIGFAMERRPDWLLSKIIGGGCLYYEASSAGKYPYKMGSQSTTLAEDATTFLGAHEL